MQIKDIVASAFNGGSAHGFGATSSCMLCALVVVAGALALRFAGQPAAARAQLNLHAQVNGSQRSAQFAQLAMIVEAVLLGYSMARRR